jgi:hypothetical protein
MLRSGRRMIASLGICLTCACGDSAANGAAAGTHAGGTGGNGGVSGSLGGSGAGGVSAGGGGSGGTKSAIRVCPKFTKDEQALQELGVTLLLEADIFGVNTVGVADGQVYFTDDGKLQRVPVSGGAAETIGPIRTNGPQLPDGDRLVWHEEQTSGETTTARVMTAPLSDPTDAVALVTSSQRIEYLRADATHVYWSTRSPANIFRAPITGGSAEQFVADGQPLGALLHQGYYYWLDFHTNSLERIGLRGGTRERLSEVGFGGAMAGDDDAVYWGDSSYRTVEKWSAETGRVRLASAEPNDVAVDGGTIYWTDGFIDGSVRSVRTDGTEPKTWLCDLRAPNRIFIDGNYVIFGSDEGILRIER